MILQSFNELSNDFFLEKHELFKFQSSLNAFYL